MTLIANQLAAFKTPDKTTCNILQNSTQSIQRAKQLQWINLAYWLILVSEIKAVFGLVNLPRLLNLGLLNPGLFNQSRQAAMTLSYQIIEYRASNAIERLVRAA